MGKYYIKDYVAHSGQKRGPKKGSQKPGHKYLFRISTGNGYKYFYTLEEYQNRFKKGLKDLGKKVSDSVKKITDGGKKKAKSVSKIADDAKKKAESVEKTVAKALESVPKRSGKALRKVNQALKKIGSSPVVKAAEKSKKKVENLIKKADKKISDKREQRKADQRHKQLQKKSKEAQKILDHKQQKKADSQHESFRKKHNKEYSELANKSKKKSDKKDNASSKSNAKQTAKAETIATKPQKKSTLQEPKNHKYLAKIEMSNGKYRYFYSQSELEGYYKKNPGQRIDGIPLKKKSATPEEDSAKVNPNYDGVSECGYSNNCYACAIAYDMRRRGYDVQAIYDEDGSALDTFVKAYKNTSLKDWDQGLATKRTIYTQYNDVDTLEKNMAKKYGKNSSGIMAIVGANGGGHALAWEINDKSKLTIYDTQDNTKYDLNSVLPYLSRETSGIQTLRTDNRELSDNVKKYVTTDQTKTEYMRDPDSNKEYFHVHDIDENYRNKYR